MLAEPERPDVARRREPDDVPAARGRAHAAPDRRAPGQTTVVVCHGGVVSAVMLSLLGHGLHMDRPFRMETENTSLTEWHCAGEGSRFRGQWVLVRYNDCAHLV